MTKVYAVAESVPNCVQHLYEPGKRYEVLVPSTYGQRFNFDIIDEEGDRIGCTWINDGDVGNWIRIEEEAPTPEQTQGAVEAMDPDALRQHAARLLERMTSTPHGPKRKRLAIQHVEMLDKARFADGWNAALDAFKKSEVGHD